MTIINQIAIIHSKGSKLRLSFFWKNNNIFHLIIISQINNPQTLIKLRRHNNSPATRDGQGAEHCTRRTGRPPADPACCLPATARATGLAEAERAHAGRRAVGRRGSRRGRDHGTTQGNLGGAAGAADAGRRGWGGWTSTGEGRGRSREESARDGRARSREGRRRLGVATSRSGFLNARRRPSAEPKFSWAA